MSGEPGTYTAGTPDDVKNLRASLIDLISKGMNTGATPYSGPLGTQADNGQIAAMNMLMGMSGNGKYSLPSTYSMPGQPSMASDGSRVGTIPGGGGATGGGGGRGGSNPGMPGTTPYNGGGQPAPNLPPDQRQIPGTMTPSDPNPRARGNGDGSSMTGGGGGMSPQALFQLINSMRGMR